MNRRLTEAELDPAITIYVEADRLHWLFFDLVIKNAGHGPARNIQFTVDPDIPVETNDPDSCLSRMAIFQRGISFMAPLQEIRTFYGSFLQLTKEPITIHVSYDRETPNAKGKTVKASFVIDIGQFQGISRVGEPYELTVTKALEKMATDLHAIKEGGSWSNVTVEVKRRYFFSHDVNRIWRRWFGGRYLNNTEFTAWQHFRKELRRTMKR